MNAAARVHRDFARYTYSVCEPDKQNSYRTAEFVVRKGSNTVSVANALCQVIQQRVRTSASLHR